MLKNNNNSNMHGLSEIGPNVPAFLVKLWKLVEDPDCDLIYWSKSGMSFIIVAQARFAREVLPLHYKHNNMASFIRQLNMYDFHKIVSIESGSLKSDKDEMEFAHQYFIKDHPYLLENIKRKLSNPKPGVVATDSFVSSNTKNGTQSDILTKLLSDVNILKGKQESWDARLSTMKRENEALWRELAIFRQKHMKQEQIINRLIHFIVTIVRPSRKVPLRRRFPLMLNDTQQVKKLDKLDDNAGSVSHGSPTGPTIHEIEMPSDALISNNETFIESTSNIEPLSPEFSEPVTEYVEVLSPSGIQTGTDTVVNQSSSKAKQNPSDWLEIVLTEDDLITNPLTPIDPVKVNPTVAAATLKHLETTVEHDNKITTPITLKIPSIITSESGKKTLIPEREIIYVTDVNKPEKISRARYIRQDTTKTEPSKTKSVNVKKIIQNSVDSNYGKTSKTLAEKVNVSGKRKLTASEPSNSDKIPNKKLLIESKSDGKETSKRSRDEPFWKLDSIYNGTIGVSELSSDVNEEDSSFDERVAKIEQDFNINDSKSSSIGLNEIDTTDFELPNASSKNDSNDKGSVVEVSPDSMAIVCQAPVDNRNEDLSRELSSHVDNVQGEIDYLKEVLKGEGYSLDMNNILGLFNEDPLSYSVLSSSEDCFKGKDGEEGNEIMTYGTPNLMDLVDLSGSTGNVHDWTNVTSPTSPTVSELSTPAPSPSRCTSGKSVKRRKI